MSITKSDIDLEFIESPTINLRWLSDDTIQIIGPNGQSDLITLTPKLSFIGATNASCTFTGKLEKDSLAEAAVVGCRSSKETVVNIGASNQVKTFILSNGTTFEVNQNTMNLRRSRRFADDADNLFGSEVASDYPIDDDYDTEELRFEFEFDYMETGEDPPDVESFFSGELPTEITINVSLGYDISFLDHTGIMLQLSTVRKS